MTSAFLQATLNLVFYYAHFMAYFKPPQHTQLLLEVTGMNIFCYGGD